MPLVAPSLLSANFANLLPDIREMEEAGASVLHFDVMDGHFVPNLTVGIPVLRSVRKVTKLELDVHLMISNPDHMAEAFAEAGADWVTVHYESSVHLNRLLTMLRERKVKPGVALNPHTPVSVLEESLFLCHHVLIMSVNPGFGGQKFISTSFEKVRKLMDLIRSRGLEVRIEIDGGIGPANTAEAVESGVDVIVAGSAIFDASSPREAFRLMQRSADETRAAKVRASAPSAQARSVRT
ncbi:MAG: ribulose-phosphate 3-epimerase [Acidobacteria bacterium]|nr:MAG: ribulose-phosphate 3-epimerase [Acidobacteriota bacterium]